MATSRSVPRVREAISYPVTNTGDLDGTIHVAAFACSTLCRSASLFGSEARRARFRLSTRRSMVGQVHARCDATQHAHFGRCSSHFFFRFRHVRQPVFVRNDACEVPNGFIVDRKLHTLARNGSLLMSCSCLMHVTCLTRRIEKTNRAE